MSLAAVHTHWDLNGPLRHLTIDLAGNKVPGDALRLSCPGPSSTANCAGDNRPMVRGQARQIHRMCQI